MAVLLALVIMVSLFGLISVTVFEAAKLAHEETVPSEKNYRIPHVYTMAELEKIRAYGLMFSLNNSHDFDANQLLKYGKKVERSLGSDKVSDIVETICHNVELLLSPMHKRNVSSNHNVIRLIEATELIERNTLTIIYLTRRGGVSRGEEGNIAV